MNIPLIDLKKQYNSIKPEIDKAIEGVILDADFVLGKELKLFESEFADYCGTKFAVGVDSGTSALELVLRGYGIGAGDEVIVPTFTFYSTASAVCYTGAKPVFVDVEPETGNIDTKKIKNKINKGKTKIIMPVHIFGQPANMSEIDKLAQEYGLRVIEDACQAHGARYIGKKVGGIANAGCFSFYPAKNLGAYGDGGMIVTNDPELFEKVMLLRDCGRVKKYMHVEMGFTKRLDTIQAAVLRVKLHKLDSWNNLRKKNAALYEKKLAMLGIKPLETKKYADPVFHMYVACVKDRDKLRDFLSEKGIGTGVHYPLPLHLQPVFGFLGGKKGDYPVSEKLSEEVISLPMYPELTENEIDIVVNEIGSFYKK